MRGKSEHEKRILTGSEGREGGECFEFSQNRMKEELTRGGGEGNARVELALLINYLILTSSAFANGGAKGAYIFIFNFLFLMLLFQ